jgi:FAD/FMN-containing dehydrogenase
VDLTAFADAVGADDPVTIAGGATQGGAVTGVRCVRAPAGIERITPAEMTVVCGAGTPIAELDAALAEHGQRVALPSWPGASVGGLLAVGQSGIRRLGYGPVRDTLLQARVVSAQGVIVKAGGPTVKNVSGFDLCRLLVGSHGTLAFIGEVMLRTWPLPPASHWFAGTVDPFVLRARLLKPTSILWDGTTTWVCLEGHPDDIAAEARLAPMYKADGPPTLPNGGRRSMPPATLRSLDPARDGPFVAEIGVGVVHSAKPPTPPPMDSAVAELNARIKREFDPSGRLNPGRGPST